MMFLAAPISAQEEYRWSRPERIFGLANEAWTPVIIADRNNAVHAFTHQPVGENGEYIAIVYTRWQQQVGWLPPNDILLSPMEQARLLDVYLDDSGMFHLIFFGGNDLGANVYYSSAPAEDAGNATAWSTPKVIGSNALAPESGAIIGDANGNLIVIYSGNPSGNGVYAIHSSDAGANWSTPVILNPTYSQQLRSFGLRLFVDSKGNIHLLWSEYNTEGMAERIHYARLDPELEELSTHRIFDEQGEILNGETFLIEYEEELFLFHYGTDSGVMTRFMRRSSDGGDTWTEMERLFPHVGSNGFPAVVIDSSGTMHMMFGNRLNTDNGIIHGMWHSIWLDGHWTEPQPIVSGEKRPDFDPTRPRAVIVHGNLIFLTWMTDTGGFEEEYGGTFDSYVVVDAPESAEEEMPVVLLEPEPTQTPLVLADDTVPMSDEQVLREDTPITPLSTVSNDEPSRFVYIGTIPVVLLILLFLLGRIVRRHGSLN